MDIGYAMNYQYLNEINMTPSEPEPTWGWFGQGISSITKDKSETTTEEYYYDGFGHAETSVEGMSQSLTVEGKRRLDDETQNWVASLAEETGDLLNTQLRQTDPTGKVIERDVTIHEIKAGQDGAANEKAKFSCKISFDGPPRIVQEPVGSAYPEKVEAKDVTLNAGETAQIAATVTPEDANPRCVYATGNHKVATVSLDGTIKGVAPGTTMITIKAIARPSIVTRIKVTVANAAQAASAKAASAKA